MEAGPDLRGDRGGDESDPGAGGVGGAVGGNVAKAGLKQVATGLAKGAATNFAAGAGTGLVTGQGVKNSLTSGLQAAGSGGSATGGLGALAKTVGKNVAVGAGGQLAAKGLQKAGVPGAAAQEGGNVFSQYLGNQINKPGQPATAGFGASARPQGAGGINFNLMPNAGGTTGAAAPAGGTNWKGVAATGLGALATGIANRGTGGTTGANSPTGQTGGPYQAPTTTQMPSGSQRIPTSTAPITPVTGQAPQQQPVQAPAAPSTPADPNRPASFGERYGPLIAQGAGLAVGAYAGKKATDMALKRSPEEQAALTGAQGAAGQLGTNGQQAWQRGNDLQQAPGQYFQTLLSGNRAAMSQAIAGPAAQITGNYRGAQRALDQSGVRGAARDVAVGDLNRDRVSKIAGLTTGMQPYAAEQLTSMGQQQQALAPGMLTASGQLHSNLLTSGAVNRQYARKEGEKTAEAIGGLAREVGEVAFKRPQGGVAQPQPSQTPPQTATPPQGGTSTPPPVQPVMAPPSYKRPATGYPSTNINLPTFGTPPPAKNNPWGNVSFGY